ncbi:MAG: diphosphomevalonate decarboxylase [Myxococcota bacterium]
MRQACARAHTNIALVKYWGKRDAALNLPAVGSLSLTLDRFYTTTTARPIEGERDELVLDGRDASEKERARVSRFLDVLRTVCGGGPRLHIDSINTVPTAAGLASSASAFAALTLSVTTALGKQLEVTELSRLARQGSGSAARSLFGGFAVLHRGERPDGADCFAEPLEAPASLDVRLLVVRCGTGPKAIGSTEAMERTAQTSPLYGAWVSTHAADLSAGVQCVREGRLDELGEVMEHSTLKMHATGLGATPGFWYFAPTTVAVMDRVRQLRRDGARCWFTMDAGPHVKVLVPTAESTALAPILAEVPGVVGVDVAAPGPAAHVVVT